MTNRFVADSASHLPSSPPVRRFALTGPSVILDPASHAYRSDIADVALAGRVIASHYAEPAMRRCLAGAMLTTDVETVALAAGEVFAVLACARGQAWGYVVAGHRVGSVDESALA